LVGREETLLNDAQRLKQDLAEEMVEQYEEGRMSRRHMLKTVGQILGVTVVSPTLLASLGCSTPEAGDEEQEAAPVTESGTSGVTMEPDDPDIEAHGSPANGARLVARAWDDPAFKSRLLSDTKAAAAELGIDTSGPIEFVTVENTLQVHNLIVCTLCSCYPKAILGSPPDWYTSDNYRSRALLEPRAVLREFGFDPGDNVKIAVHDSTYEIRYMVLPMRPPGTKRMSQEELTQLVTRDCLIGVEIP
jgi:nitrile hydratase subunit alpha